VTATWKNMPAAALSWPALLLDLTQKTGRSQPLGHVLDLGMKLSDPEMAVLLQALHR